MKLTPEQLRSLAKVTLATRPDEIDCEEWLQRVGCYVEHHHSGRAIPDHLRCVAEHVALCPECAEELKALEAALSGER